MKKLVQYLVKLFVFKTGKFAGVYRKICDPGSEEYAEFYKRHGGLHTMGENCRFNPHVNITDPAYVSIGNNVTLSHCDLIGHDGVVGVLNNAYNMKLDAVGKIVIKDNVFIGQRAIVLRGVTIGANVIVGSGSLVIKDVADGNIVGGVPAKVIGRTEDLAKRLQEQTKALPWASLIEQREGSYDPVLEPKLVEMRVKHFFPES